MKHIRYYLHHLSLRRQAHIWLKANPHPEAIAARALFKLNRHARASHADRDNIHLLKNQLLRLFCQKLPYTARTQIQKRYCYSCDGTGEYWTGEECYHCGGTGVYSTNRLYLFTFDVDGRKYSWHQPESLVDWPVEVCPGRPGRYESSLDDDDIALESEYRHLLLWVLYEYLCLCGQKPDHTIPSLSWAIRAEWNDVISLDLWEELVIRWQSRKIPF